MICNLSSLHRTIWPGPDDFLTIDETIYSRRDQISFKQYNSSKPQNMAYSSSLSFQASVYNKKSIDDPSLYYIPIVQALMSQLSIYVDLQGRNITMDRLYKFRVAATVT